MGARLRDLQRRLARHGYWLAVLAISVSTVAFLLGRNDFAKGQWALLYLLIVVLVAGASGTGPALVAAILAFLAWDFFFLPPYLTFTVRDPKDYVSLLAFLAVGLAMGLQTGRMRDREERAIAREHETALLNRLSARLVSETSTETMAYTVLEEIVEVVGATSAALFVGGEGGLLSFCASLPSGLPDRDVVDGAQWAYSHDCALGLPGSHRLEPPQGASHEQEPVAAAFAGVNGAFIPLHSGAGVTGVLVVRGRRNGHPYDAAETRLMASLANLIGVFLERQNLQAKATRAEALREADRLKSSLLSSVSHELKTPLAALTATVSNLLESDVAWDERSVHDELRGIVDDIARLNNSINSLLDLSRLEARSWEPSKDLYELSEIVAASTAALPAHQRARVEVSLPDDLPLVEVDFVQWARVLQNLVENALIYAGESSPVRIGARASAGSVDMWVEDEGPGISEEERERIFEKFYRAQHAGTKAPSGTGLGLAITREIVKAHGGEVWVEPARPAGARFVVSLPASQRRAANEHP